MSKCRKIESAVFERDWRPVYDRVFKKGIGVGYDESPFVDPSWRSVPMPRNPFWTGEVPGLTRPDDFPPIEPYFPDYYQPLFLTLAEFGIDRMVTGVDIESWFETAATREGVEETPWSAIYPMYEFFSAEGSWGLISDWEDLAMLGGTPEFMETFYRIGGGERAVQARFLYFLLGEEGNALQYNGIFTPSYYQTRWVLVNMYQQAGWPLPNRWHCYYEEEIDWSWMMDDEGFPET